MTNFAFFQLSRRSMISIVALLMLLATSVLIAVYGRAGAGGNAETGNCAESAAVSARLASIFTGEVAGMKRAPSKPLPDFTFSAPDGPKSLRDFRGKIVLFNLWATWCVPCREEMPALDALNNTFEIKEFSVVAVNMDTRNLERVPQWLDDNKIVNLTRYMDSEGKVFQSLRKEGLVTGLPTTLLIGRDGCLIGAMAGSAKWNSADALSAIRAAIGM